MRRYNNPGGRGGEGEREREREGESEREREEGEREGGRERDMERERERVDGWMERAIALSQRGSSRAAGLEVAARSCHWRRMQRRRLELVHSSSVTVTKVRMKLF